MVIMVYKT